MCPPMHFEFGLGYSSNFFLEMTNFSLVREASDQVRKGPPYEILVFLMNFIFSPAKGDNFIG